MKRTSSPSVYGRTSSKFMPRPLKTLWYWPPKAVSTLRRVFSSRWRIFLRMSRVSAMAKRIEPRQSRRILSESSASWRRRRDSSGPGWVVEEKSLLTP